MAADSAIAIKPVDQIVEYRARTVWKDVDVRRVRAPGMPFADQILILLASAGGSASSDDLFQWVEHGNRGNFNKILRRLHSKRFIEFEGPNGGVEILPPGKQAAFELPQS
jgi:hypothetical protein